MPSILHGSSVMPDTCPKVDVSVMLCCRPLANFLLTDGKSHKSHKFELVSGSHMLDTVLDGIKIAEGIYDRAGHIQVDDTTPENYTVPGYYGY